MNEKLLSLSYELKNLLDNDPRIVDLNIIEKEMNESEEVMKLAYQKDLKEAKYSDILKIYSQDSIEAKSIYHELLLAKNNLEAHHLVKKYMEQFIVVRKLYSQLNDILFSSYNIYKE